MAQAAFIGTGNSITTCDDMESDTLDTIFKSFILLESSFTKMGTIKSLWLVFGVCQFEPSTIQTEALQLN